MLYNMFFVKCLYIYFCCLILKYRKQETGANDVKYFTDFNPVFSFKLIIYELIYCNC